MFLRRATPADLPAIAAIHSAAFGQQAEPDLALALVADGWVIEALSLIVEIDGAPIGHVMCSRGSVDGVPAPGLGPIGILPAHQRSGAGSALMHASIAAADALGEPLIALLGDPRYYSRFGFVPSRDVGVAAPDPAWGGYFQVRTLFNHHPSVTGAFTYAAPFEAL